jgi:hypothetical protein
MSVRSLLVASLASLVACGGGSGSTLPAGGTEPPGTNLPSSASPLGGGGGGLDIGANFGPGGALFFNDRPALGEPSISGLVVVIQAATQGAPPPADTVVTLNGVQLVHAVLGGAVSPMYFTVDPAGTQPTIAPDGFLHLNASSASTGASRTLNLACPDAVAATLTPAPGASLSGAPSVKLSWPSGSLPVQARDFTAFGLVGPSASLHGFDGATGSMSSIANPQLLAPDSGGATLAVGATTASGYAVELRYPGVFFLDGETGGACGRTQRFIYVK